MAELQTKCPECGLIVLAGYIFDEVRKFDDYGPILGLHTEANPETAKAGYVGMGSLDMTETHPEIYRCPKCEAELIARNPNSN